MRSQMSCLQGCLHARVSNLIIDQLRSVGTLSNITFVLVFVLSIWFAQNAAAQAGCSGIGIAAEIIPYIGDPNIPANQVNYPVVVGQAIRYRARVLNVTGANGCLFFGGQLSVTFPNAHTPPF